MREALYCTVGERQAISARQLAQAHEAPEVSTPYWLSMPVGGVWFGFFLTGRAAVIILSS